MGQIAFHELSSTGLFEGVDLIIPIPISKKRLRTRGYNQAEQIAIGLSQASGIPMRKDTLRRNGDRISQTHLSHGERMQNAEGAFELNRVDGLNGLHVMIVDDVMTTGSTMESAINTLLEIPGITITAFAWAWTRSNPFNFIFESEKETRI